MSLYLEFKVLGFLYTTVLYSHNMHKIIGKCLRSEIGGIWSEFSKQLLVVLDSSLLLIALLETDQETAGGGVLQMPNNSQTDLSLKLVLDKSGLFNQS